MSGTSDYYEILGLRRGASAEEIKRAYRRLAKESHPDSGDPGDVVRFREIREAYETLSDADRRRSYDARGGGAGPPVSWTGGFEETLRPFREELARRRRSPPVHLDIVLSEEEARRGGEAVLEVPGELDCERCGGRGIDFFGWCSECGGEGFARVYERIRFRIPGGVEGGEILTARRRDGSAVRAQIRVRYY